MYKYLTVSKSADAEQTIEKSRFIANVAAASSKEEADAFIAQIRAKYKDATHNVPAFVIGEKMQMQWASDDGEPQGTSGAPIVQMLVKEGITNVVVVVTRYFGGIKLGTGGLVRAYTSSAKLGLEAAEICGVKDKCKLCVQMDYTFLSKLQNLTKDGKFSIGDIAYSDKLKISLSCELEDKEEVLSILSNLTSGSFELLSDEVVPMCEIIGDLK